MRIYSSVNIDEFKQLLMNSAESLFGCSLSSGWKIVFRQASGSGRNRQGERGSSAYGVGSRELQRYSPAAEKADADWGN